MPTKPEVVARTASESETPTNARKLAQLARNCGWRVWVTYARGTSLPTRSNPNGELRESIAVRMRREGRALVAIWSRPVPNFERRQPMRFVMGGAPFELMTLNELRAVIDS